MGATVNLNFRVTQWLPKKDGKEILKGEYSPSLPFGQVCGNANLIASIYLYMEAGSPLSASLPTFFAIKKVGAARPERKQEWNRHMPT